MNKPVQGKRVKWDNRYYLQTYLLSRQGYKRTAIAEALDMSVAKFRQRLAADPALAEAYRRGKSEQDKSNQTTGSTFLDYVYERLPSGLKHYWDSLARADKETNNEKKVEAILADCGKQTIQHLWVHAYVCSRFDVNEACRKVNVGVKKLRHWIENDPDFGDLFDIIKEAKKDFIEASLMNLVGQGDTAATIFASKTQLRDRGYDPKVTIRHEGAVTHGHVSIDNILSMLPVEVRKQVLDQIRSKSLPAHDPDVQDAEVIERERH